MKILIVDDEQIMRNGLRYTVDWDKYGFEVIDAVSNGQKALDVCETNIPDIVITDIRMPVMDGLELTKRLLTKYPEMQIVIISAYDDFKYVQEALRAGAKDYILKAELDCDNLIALLLKIQEKQSESKKQKIFDYYMEDLQENLLIKLLTTICYETEVQRKIEELNLNVVSEPLILIHVFSAVENCEGKIREIIREISSNFMWLTSSKKHWIILMNAVNGRDEKFLTWLKRIRNVCDGNVYCSENFKGFQEVMKINKEMEPWMEQYNFYEKSTVMVCSRKEPEFTELNASRFFMDLMQQLEGGHIEKAKQFTEEMIKELESVEYKPGDVYKMLSMLCNVLEEKSEKKTAEEYNVRRYKSSRELLENVRIYIQELFESIEESVWHGDEIVSKAIKYVQEHIQEDITLVKVSGEVFCSPQYLSYLFKRITGENFSEYIIRVRIKNAQRLLVTTQYSVSEIASMVGIGNSSYFSKVFTKITGISPVRYRKNFMPMKKEKITGNESNSIL